MTSLLRRALPLVTWPLVLCLLAFAVAAAQMWLA